MTDVVNTITTFSSSGTRHKLQITNESDGTGESAVSKLDISGLVLGDGTTVPSSVSLLSVQYQVTGFNYVTLYWDHTTDDEMVVLSGNGFFDYEGDALVDPKSAGDTGDVLLTTDGAIDGASYNIILEFRLEK